MAYSEAKKMLEAASGRMKRGPGRSGAWAETGGEKTINHEDEASI